MSTTMRRHPIRGALLGATTALALTAVGCQEGAMEEAGEEADEVVEEIQDEVDDAIDD